MPAEQGAMAVYGEAFYSRAFGNIIPAPEKHCQTLQDGDQLSMGRHQLLFIDTPRHANHHGCFFHEPKGNLYTRDTFGLHYDALDHGHHHHAGGL